MNHHQLIAARNPNQYEYDLLTYAVSVMAAVSDRRAQFPVGASSRCRRVEATIRPNLGSARDQMTTGGTKCSSWTSPVSKDVDTCSAPEFGRLETEVVSDVGAFPGSRRRLPPPVNVERSLSSSSLSPPLPVGSSAFNVWEDFARNGRDSELEESKSVLSQSPVSAAGSWTASEESSESRTPRAIIGRHFNWPSQAGNAMNIQHHCLDTVSDARKLQVKAKHQAVTGSQQQCCVLCRTNGEPKDIYQSHSLKDSAGKVTCPVLYQYICPYCGATGRRAHTIRYCPSAPPGVSVIKSLKTTRDSTGHRRSR